jgi:hypothetical protein
MPLSIFLMMHGCSMAETAREGMGSHGAGSVLAVAALMSRLLLLLFMVGVSPEELGNMCTAAFRHRVWMSLQNIARGSNAIRRAAVLHKSYVFRTLPWRSVNLADDSNVQLGRLPGDDARCRS